MTNNIHFELKVMLDFGQVALIKHYYLPTTYQRAVFNHRQIGKPIAALTNYRAAYLSALKR